jgi:hypothetical protein
MSERARNESALATSVSGGEDSLLLVESEPVYLVQEPDATLVVHHVNSATAKQFSVSTTVLKLASRYFDRLLYSHMAEAQALANAKAVTINLDRDNPSAVV